MKRHTKEQKLHTSSGDLAGARAVFQEARADLETNPRKKGQYLAAASRLDRLAGKNYDVARFHEAKATRHQKALDRLTNL